MWDKLDANMMAADAYYSDYQTDEDAAQDILDGMDEEEIVDIAENILDIDIIDEDGQFIQDGLDDVVGYIAKNISSYQQEEY